MDTIFFQKLTPDAVIPTRAHPMDAGLDLSLIEPVKIFSDHTTRARTGVAVVIPKGYVGEVYVRSSIAAKQGVTLANSVGVIDAGYMGEIQLLLHNHSRSAALLPAGSRVAQLVIKKIELPTPVVVDVLPSSARGSGGFGSTGV